MSGICIGGIKYEFWENHEKLCLHKLIGKHSTQDAWRKLKLKDDIIYVNVEPDIYLDLINLGIFEVVNKKDIGNTLYR